MKCINCGYDNDEDAHFCINCGSSLAYNRNPLEGIMSRLLKDSLFMVLCILYSIGVVFSLLSRDIQVIRILMVIFLWLLYAQSKRGTVDSKYMRYISGTIFASYIVRWILGCLLVLCGFFLLAVAIMMESSSQWETLYSAIRPYIEGYNRIGGDYADLFLVLFSCLLILGAIIAIIINVAGMRSIHRFAQSLYRSLEEGQWNMVKCGSARIWLMIYGVFGALSASRSRNAFSFLGEGCLAAAVIIGSVLVKKYFGNLE